MKTVKITPVTSLEVTGPSNLTEVMSQVGTSWHGLIELSNLNGEVLIVVQETGEVFKVTPTLGERLGLF